MYAAQIVVGYNIIKIIIIKIKEACNYTAINTSQIGSMIKSITRIKCKVTIQIEPQRLRVDSDKY